MHGSWSPQFDRWAHELLDEGERIEVHSTLYAWDCKLNELASEMVVTIQGRSLTTDGPILLGKQPDQKMFMGKFVKQPLYGWNGMTSRDVLERKLAMVHFDPIMYKLVRSDDGPRWTLTRAQQVERWYRKYHILFFLFPNEIIVPTVEVDDFWHQHILDTKKYADDCTFLPWTLHSSLSLSWAAGPCGPTIVERCILKYAEAVSGRLR